MELVEELNTFKPNYFTISDRVSKLSQENAEKQELLNQTNNVLENLREAHSKTISNEDELKESMKKTMDKLSSLQLQYDLKVRDLQNTREELGDYKIKMNKFNDNSTTAIEKLENE